MSLSFDPDKLVFPFIGSGRVDAADVLVIPRTSDGHDRGACPVADKDLHQ